MLTGTNSSISPYESFNSNTGEKSYKENRRDYLQNLYSHAFRSELTVTHNQVGMWAVVLSVSKQPFKVDRDIFNEKSVLEKFLKKLCMLLS